MHTVEKMSEKLPYYALLFNNSTPSLYVEVQWVTNWVENGLVEAAKCCLRKIVKREASPF